jgi:hypothetical protein
VLVTPRAQIGAFPDSKIKNQQSEIINQFQIELRALPCSEFFPNLDP